MVKNVGGLDRAARFVVAGGLIAGGLFAPVSDTVRYIMLGLSVPVMLTGVFSY